MRRGRRALAVLVLAGAFVGLTTETASAAGREICPGVRIFTHSYEVCIPVP